MIPIEGLFIALATGMLGVFAGAAVSRWLKQPSPKPAPSQAEEMLERLGALYQWTDSFARDISDYYGEMEQIAGQCGYELGDDPPPPRMLLGMLSQICGANERLRTRLDAAETQLQSQRQELADYLSEARTDGLTGLPNRRAFDDELARRIAEWRRYGTPLSLALIDVDHFKALNDTQGHLAGDHALRETARVLRGVMRETDLVARYGGEEFAVILPNTPDDAAWHAVERAREAVERLAMSHDGHEIRVTVSCGAAQAQSEEESPGLIRRADVALYAAKHAGRNNSQWHDGTNCFAIEKRSHRLIGTPTAAPTPAPKPVAAEARPGEIRIQHAASDRSEENALAEFQSICHSLRRRLRELAAEPHELEASRRG